MRETFAYLKEVLGIKYLPIAVPSAANHSQVAFSASTPNPQGIKSPIPNDPVIRNLSPDIQKKTLFPNPESAPSSASATSDVRPSASLEELQAQIHGCTRCKLSKGRKTIVFGDGVIPADLMFVGEAPGENEDLEGLPFVGPAGQLLTKMIGAMGLSRKDVYITNVVKCRPPMNRNPEADEILECSPF